MFGQTKRTVTGVEMQDSIIKAFFDEATFTITYVVSDAATKVCAIIDSVLDYDPKSGRTTTTSADKVIAYIAQEKLDVAWVLETHVHADHLTAAPYLKEKLGGQIAIGAGVPIVQDTFKKVFNLDGEFATDGRQFDVLLEDEQRLALGESAITVWAVPGHTPACVAYLIDDAVFVGDTMFMPDYGSARCDFPGGDARTLYKSVQRLLSLPPETRLFMCHDYAPGGRDYIWETTVGCQRADNPHIKDGVSEDEFVEIREGRDKDLSAPVLLLPAVQVNMRGGHFPDAEDNGIAYLKLPINAI